MERNISSMVEIIPNLKFTLYLTVNLHGAIIHPCVVWHNKNTFLLNPVNLNLTYQST